MKNIESQQQNTVIESLHPNKMAKVRKQRSASYREIESISSPQNQATD